MVATETAGQRENVPVCAWLQAAFEQVIRATYHATRIGPERLSDVAT